MLKKFKDENGNLVTKKEVIHAELNALMKLASIESGNSQGATAYLTLSPCFQCCLLLIQSKIERLVYLEEYRDISGIEMLRESGIIVEKLEK